MFVMINPEDENFNRNRDFWCGMFLLLCFLIGILGFLQKYIFMYIGENLTLEVRSKLFRNILFQSISWFDSKERAPGILSNVLSEDISALNGMTTEYLAVMLEAMLGLVFGIVIAMIYSWRMGLITLAMVPLVTAGTLLSWQLDWKKKPTQDGDKVDDPYAQSNALLSDIILNYRTVVSFGEKNIDQMLNKYDSLLYEPNLHTIKTAHKSGFFFGYSQCIRFIFTGIVFYISAVMIYTYFEDPKNNYISVNTLFVSAMGSGTALSAAPSISKARSSAKKIF